MKKLKGAAAVLVVLSLLLSFTGCSLRFSSFDSLLRPPRATGKFQGLQEAFEKSVGTDYVLYSPETGDYNSAFLTYDCDSDGDEDAFVFYALKDAPDVAKIGYLKFEKEQWNYVCSVEGAGSSVNKVLFSDVDYDGMSEIIIGWNLLSGKVSKSFVTYMLSDGELTALTAYPYNYLTLLDVNGDGIDDIFTLYIDSAVPEMPVGYARVYNYNIHNSALEILSETRTDGNVSGYSSVITEKVDNINYIYIEASKGENESLTELVYWDDGKSENKLISPLFDSESQTTQSTWRSFPITCMDINDDGFLEIPVNVVQKDYSQNDFDEGITDVSEDTSKNNTNYIKWVKYRDGRLSDVQYSIINVDSGYFVNIPSSWVERISVRENNGQIDVLRWHSSTGKTGELLFSICSYNTAKDSKNYAGYKQLGSSGGTSYVYRITDEGYDFGIQDSHLEKGFILRSFG